MAGLYVVRPFAAIPMEFQVGRITMGEDPDTRTTSSCFLSSSIPALYT